MLARSPRLPTLLLLLFPLLHLLVVVVLLLLLVVVVVLVLVSLAGSWHWAKAKHYLLHWFPPPYVLEEEGARGKGRKERRNRKSKKIE